MPIVVPAQDEHLEYLSANLRADDQEELWAASGMDPALALRASLYSSRVAWTILQNGRPAAMFGAAPDLAKGTGLAWMLGTDEVAAMRSFVLRRSVRYIRECHAHFHTLHNWVDARNRVSINWLRWCGFRPSMVMPAYGVGRIPFINFVRTTDV